VSPKTLVQLECWEVDLTVVEVSVLHSML
jgi:hypothetical protein